MSDLPTGWEWETLGAAANWSSGGTPSTSKSEYYGGHIPWAVSGDLNDGTVVLTAATITAVGLANSSAKVVDAGTLLVAMYGASIGKLGIAGAPMATNQAIASAVPSEAVSPRWLFWWLRSERESLRGAGKGGAQPNISQSVLKAWPIPIAPRAEQERVVMAIEEAFSKLDAAEAGLRIVRQLLKRMRKAALTAAITGHLVRQDPTDEPATKLLADLGVEPLNDSGLPVLPAGWFWTQVQDVGQVDLGRQRSPKYHSGDNMKPYLRVANVFEDRIDTSDVMEMHFEPEAFERSRLALGDILLNEGQSPELLGRPAMYRGEPPEVAFTNSLLRFRAGPSVEPEWALLVFRHHMHSGRFTRESRITTNIAHLSAARFKPVEFPVPPIEEQRRVVEEFERLSSFVTVCERAVDVGLARSAALRRSVLKAAFLGRLVPQDPSDEPVSMLLERIHADRSAADELSDGRRRRKVGAS